MFRPDPTIAVVPVTRDQVVEVVESLNRPQLSIPGKRAQPAQGHLCGVRNADGTFSAYVSLHLLESGENVVYPYEPREFSVAQYREIEAEGVQYLESLGFMLDRLHFRKLAPEQQDAALQRLPLFTPRETGPPPTTSEAPPRAAAVRLLASF